MYIALIGLAVLTILGLSYWAGTLLYRLHAQNQKKDRLRQERVDTIMQSVHVIALAIEQQQCDLSEGVIRLTNLLDALPILPQPKFAELYPGIYGLHDKISHFPTHEARAALSKKERREQDKERLAIEAEFESTIVKEVALLRQYQPSI
ncbi:MAG: DUF2489 domain-containing protein [Glaciecola sp.]|jgi:hypothetical protein